MVSLRQQILGIALITLGALLIAWGLFHGRNGSSCFDQGRQFGGMEQRAFDAAANGEAVMKTEQDAIAKGPPEECR